MPRHLADRSLGRREHEDSSRYRPRSVSPPGSSRRHNEVRDDSVRWDYTLRRSRSPRSDRRRGRNSPDRRAGRLHMSPSSALAGNRSRDTEILVHYESSQMEGHMRSQFESKYLPSEMQWSEHSRDTSVRMGYVATQFQTNQTPENTGDTPALPEFNPESSKLNSHEWLQLLEDTADERRWKQDEKLYIMTSRLAGFARQWYLTIGMDCKSWIDLKNAFFKAFPAELDYPALLTKMLARVKEEAESLSSYFLHKVALLNECEILGTKAVSCIISGLSNAKMQQQAKLQNCEDPDQLYIYLRSLHEVEPDNPRLTRALQDSTKKAKRVKKGCFHCGKLGHMIANCPSLTNHKCSVCGKIGHECNTASYINKPQMSERNQVMEGSLANVEVKSRNFTKVYINNIALRAYVDFGSEYITIKEESAIRTRLPINKTRRTVRGFAGSSLSCIGYIDTSICIDTAVANVRLMVVPDNIQSIAVVIGHAFTQQPHVIVSMDGGKLCFYEHRDNREAKYHF